MAWSNKTYYYHILSGAQPQKDPAEMSVQERLAIFSKKQGGALIPKAPFGQPVPAKVINYLIDFSLQI